MIFVFPSEIAAWEWAAFILKNSVVRAVDRERFISWDTFKEQCFQLFQKEKPVNRTIRSLFAAHILEKNRQEKNLKYFIPAEHAELSSNFRKTLESVLISHNSSRQLLGPGLDRNPKDDLSYVFREYSAFLEKHGLFEPSGSRPEIDTAGRKYLIIMPDIISDFYEYSTILEKEKDIDFYFFPEPGGDFSLFEFDTSSAENRWAAGEFEKMFTENPYASAAVTCVSGQEQNYLLREFRIRGIPFTVRGGNALADSPGARIFRHIGQLLSSQPENGMLWTVFADNAVPWKEGRMLKGLLGSLAGSNYVMNSGYSGRDELRAVLAVLRKDEYTTWYRKLVEALKRIRECRGFDSLAEAVQAFIYGFADISAFSERSLAEYQLCIADLKKLSVLKEYTEELDIPDLYAVFLDQLEQHIYVPRQEQKGVQVYPYRVAAGIPADIFILCGCTQSGVRVRQRPFPFLRDDQRIVLGAEDSDFTEAFLKAYLSCGTVCSFARETNAGPALPSGFFIRKDRLRKIREENSFYRIEKETWAGRSEASFKTYSVLHKGLDNYISINTGEGKKDYSEGDPVDPEIMQALLGENGDRVKISASSLDCCLSCAYFYLNNRLFHLEEMKTDPDFTDNRLIGTIEHEVLESFFHFVQENGGRLSAVPEETLQTILAAIFRKKVFGALSFPWFETAYLSDMEDAEKAVFTWLENEKAQFADAVPESLELELEYADRGAEILYSGKIDRVSSDKNGQFIVDYKKGSTESNSAVGRMEIGRGAIQIPFYLFLMRKNGKDPGRAYYYSFRDGKYKAVFGPDRNTVDKDKMDLIIKNLEMLAAGVVRQIREGKFPANDESCSECAFQGLCRKKFFLG